MTAALQRRRRPVGQHRRHPPARHRRWRVARAAGAAIGGLAVATAVAEVVPHGTEVSSAAYVLSVMGAALAGGLALGMATAVVATVLQFFYFTTSSSSPLDTIENFIPPLIFVVTAVVLAGLVERIDRARREAIDLARRLQASLLPPGLPHMPGLDVGARFLPGSDRLDIGGDFFDVFATDEQRWLMVIGDVRGKGVEAAAVTAIARHTLRAIAVGTEWSPESVLRRLNNVLLSDQPPLDHGQPRLDRAGDRDDPRFLTAALLSIERASAAVAVTVCCAGHPLPIVVRRSSEITVAGKPGMVLGIVSEPELPEALVALDPGDVLVAFTDGLTERRRDGEFFQDRQLEAVLAAGAGAGDDAQELADRLVAAAAAFGADSLADDVAVLTLRVVGPSPPPPGPEYC